MMARVGWCKSPRNETADVKSLERREILLFKKDFAKKGWLGYFKLTEAK